jgi:hypothetical protein
VAIAIEADEEGPPVPALLVVEVNMNDLAARSLPARVPVLDRVGAGDSHLVAYPAIREV